MPNEFAKYVLDKMAKHLTDDDEVFEVELRPVRKAEKLSIPARFFDSSNLNGDSLAIENHQEIAAAMCGYPEALSKHLEAARRFIDGGPVSLPLFKKSRIAYEDDIEAVALATYNVSITDEHRQALRLILESDALLKSEEPTLDVSSFTVLPATKDAVEMAEAVQRACKVGQINPVKLNGKHSKGSMIAQDPQDRRLYLLKPGYGKNSPAKGVNEDASSQSEREAAFYHAACVLGIEDNFPRADLILINNHQTAAMELLPVNYRNLGEKKKRDPNIAPHILRPYLDSGLLFKWAALDFILGNPDRHSQNIMVDPDNKKVVLIDHGSAMAGRSFDPAGDDNSFIPYYLRAWTGRKFTLMNPKERVNTMPHLNPRAEQVFEEWVKEINENQLSAVLQQYHVNPEPALERLAVLKMMPGPKWLVLNKLWAGDVV